MPKSKSDSKSDSKIPASPKRLVFDPKVPFNYTDILANAYDATHCIAPNTREGGGKSKNRLCINPLDFASKARIEEEVKEAYDLFKWDPRTTALIKKLSEKFTWWNSSDYVRKNTPAPPPAGSKYKKS